MKVKKAVDSSVYGRWEDEVIKIFNMIRSSVMHGERRIFFLRYDQKTGTNYAAFAKINEIRNGYSDVSVTVLAQDTSKMSLEHKARQLMERNPGVAFLLGRTYEKELQSFAEHVGYRHYKIQGRNRRVLDIYIATQDAHGKS